MTTVAIGLDVGGTSTKGALVTPDGTLLERHEVRTEPQAATKTIIAVAEHLFARAIRLDHSPVAFGIGAAGFVDFSSGSVIFSPNLVYDDPDIAAALRGRFAEPVVVRTRPCGGNEASAPRVGTTMSGSLRSGLESAAVSSWTAACCVALRAPEPSSGI
jgi:hypothetical protein